MTTSPIVPTITLSCDISTPSTIIIRPIGTGLKNEHKIRHPSGLQPGGVNNYQQVYEEICDNSGTFIGWDEPSIVSDLYLFDQISLPSNYSIESIVVTGMNLYDHSLATNYKYKLLIYDGDLYESPNLQVKSGAGDYWFWHTPYGSANWAWSSQPSDGSPLTETYINNLQIGVKTSSPTFYDPNLVPVWVTGNGDTIELTPQGSANNWENIDEDWIFSETDYNYSTTVTTWKYDLYNLCEYPLPEQRGPIRYVTVYAFCRQNYVWGTMSQARNVIKTHGTVYYSDPVNVGNQSYWQNGPVETTYYTNPFTGSDWTWDEVDDLQAGVGLYMSATASWVRCASCFVEVGAHSQANAMICTSQLYATLNININTTETCSLPKPEDVRVNHDVNTMGLNFWSGNREVYALGRTSKRTFISGVLWDGCTDGTSTCEDIIACVRTMAKRQLPIVLTGMRYTNLNTNYNIISFAWKRIQAKPNCYEWQLELEWCDDSIEPGG